MLYLSRKISIIALVVIFVLLIGQVTAFAAETPNVKDYLDFLKSEELNDIQGLIENTKKDYNLDVVVVIVEDTEGKSSRDFADDYYDYNGFGVGNDKSGLLMLVNMEQREVWISTTGKAIDIFTDNRISDMVRAVTGYLSNADYYNASREFIAKIRLYADMGVPSGQHRVDTEASDGGVSGQQSGKSTTYLGRVGRMASSLPVYIVALIISILATIVVSLSSKGQVTTTNRTYEERDSFELTGTMDDYLRESTTRVKIQRSSSSSSTHSGSSGTSHGGGGGSF